MGVEKLDPRRWPGTLPLVLLLIVFVWSSIYGIDFGQHWDENYAKFNAVESSVKTGLFMQAAENPQGYIYGGVNYLFTWMGLTPELVRFLVKGPFTREALAAVITNPIIYGGDVRGRVRGIYIVVSSLSIVWLYCLNLTLGRSRTEALIAAAVLGGSWEVAYHSRWVAPDVIMMQFCLLSFLCLAVGYRSQRTHWLYLSAIAVGLTIGTKYPGGIVLPFCLAGSAHVLWRQRRSASRTIAHCAGLTGTATLAFLITTPGALLDPFRFHDQVKALQGLYASGWFGYTVTPGLHHLYRMLEYVTLQVFSHYWAVSIPLAVLCVVGLMALLLEARTVVLLALGFVAAYIAYFSQQAAMIVRNVLVVVPFLSLAVARGVSVVGQRMSPRPRAVFHGFIAAFILVNLSWEVYAANTIKLRGRSEMFLARFSDYVERSGSDTFLVSAQLNQALHKMRPALPANIVTDSQSAYTRVAFFQTESADKFAQEWPQNLWNLYVATFGPLEVNLEAYSTFIGNQRILVVSRDRFSKLPITPQDLLIPSP